MRHFLSGLIIIAFSIAAPLAAGAAEYQEGEHYTKLASPQPGGGDKVEVIEFFWYGCSHCNDFEPHISKWKKTVPENVKVTFVPAIFRPQWKVHAQTYYAIELLGLVDKVHSRVFDQIHKHHKPANTIEQMADIVAELGVDRQEFLDAVGSFVVDSQIRKAAKMLQDYRISGVPTVAVNGKYTITGLTAGGHPQMLDVADYLIGLESEASK